MKRASKYKNNSQKHGVKLNIFGKAVKGKYEFRGREHHFKPLYSLKHSPINAYFSKNSDDFVVRERPLYELAVRVNILFCISIKRFNHK